MKVAVIGSGVMGPGIAQVFMTGGHQVVLADIKLAALEAGVRTIKEGLDLMQREGLLTKEPRELLSQLQVTTSLPEAVGDARLVVEAVPENLEIKGAVYKELDKFCQRDAVIVSNTSSFPLPELFPDFRPGRFFVAHFFNPAPIIPLVELVKNQRVDPELVVWLKGELEACGKTPIVLNGFKVGFLVNRLQTALMREAFHLVESGIVSLEDLDLATRAAIGFKAAWQGTFETMDFIGLDTVAFACAGIFPDLSNETRVPAIITEKVRRGELGVKTGRGFYNYEKHSEETLEKRQTVLLEQLKLWRKYS